MTQRRLLLEEDDEELPVRRRSQDPYLEGILKRDCVPCKGTGWGALFSGGGSICAKCGGSGRQPNRKQP